MHWTRRLFSLILAASALYAHAPITPPLRGPLRIEGTRILDASGAPVLLRGAVLPDLDAAIPAALGVIRIRWNLNTVRIPVRIEAWQREGRPYLDRAIAAVNRANQADLFVVLAAAGPAEGARPFWTEWAAAFRDNPNVLFSLLRPAAQENWPAWQSNLQPIADAVRAAGARQIIAAAAVDFQGFQPENQLSGREILYEAPAAFGTLPGRLPLYAGEWSLTGYATPGKDPLAVSDAIFQALYDFDDRGVSWTAATFSPGTLVTDTVEFEPTALAQTILSWVTGDPVGFGYLRSGAIANAAGGPASPVSPGQLMALYLEQMGPSPDQAATLDPTGRLPKELGGTRVLFDGQPAPILYAGQYQINVQVPKSLEPGRETRIQVFYNGVPSNRIQVSVVTAAPELFHDPRTRTAIALNENGTRNTAAEPAAQGAIVVLFATGTGTTTPGGEDGTPAKAPHPILTNPIQLKANGREAEILFAGEVPGFIGLTQINARLPNPLPSGQVPLELQIANRPSQAPVTISVR